MFKQTTLFSKISSVNFLLFLTFFGSTVLFAQEKSINPTQHKIMDEYILMNAKYLSDFNEALILSRYNSFETKEISYTEYLRYMKVNAIQEALHSKGHSHTDIPSKTLDCSNLGFENGAFATGWTGGISTYDTPFTNNTLVSNGINALATNPNARHTLLNTPPGQNNPTLGTVVGYDNLAINPTTGLADIPFLPSGGGNYSVRLGNQMTGSQIEKLTFNIDVSASNSLFYYQFAIVFQSPAGHTAATSSYFNAKLKNSSGAILPIPAGQYTVNASQVIGDTTFLTPDNQTYYKKWTSVVCNLSAYIGQTITLEFETADCGLGGHFGYAYVNAGCGVPGSLAISSCYSGGVSTLEGPTGLYNYQWYGPNNSTLAISGATNSSYTVNAPVNGDSYHLEFSETAGGGIIFDDIQISTDSLFAFGNGTINFCANNSTALLKAATGKSNYQWFDGTITAISGATNSTLPLNSPVIGDTFYVKFDENGCSKWQAVAVIPQPYEITQISLTGSCAGFTNGAILATAVSPSTILKYTLNPGGLLDFNGAFQNLAPGTYQLNISDPTNTCTTQIDTTIVVPTFQQAYAGTGDTITICKNEAFDLFQALTGNTDSSGVWSGQSGTQLINGNMPPYVMTNAGTFVYSYLVTNVLCPSDSTKVIVNVLNNCSLGLNEFLNLESVFISPNPSLEKFQITFGDGILPERYTITDVTGRIIKSGIINQDHVTIDLSIQAAGEYHINFLNKDTVMGTKKIVKL